MLTWYFLVYFRFQSIIFDFHAFFIILQYANFLNFAPRHPKVYIGMSWYAHGSIMTNVHKDYV